MTGEPQDQDAELKAPSDADDLALDDLSPEAGEAGNLRGGFLKTRTKAD
ncbi:MULTISPECIES: hypothetical protein [unclassified Mycolicibacterium]|nr:MULTISPECIES: hypothetical protein [unclassified Mycolicibacterium]